MGEDIEMGENKGPTEWLVYWKGDRGVEWDVDGT